MEEVKTTWIDVYFCNYKCYRKLTKGTWYKHQNTYQLPCLIFDYYWARYGELNRFTKIVEIEKWQ
jgi:hypothetical protein